MKSGLPPAKKSSFPTKPFKVGKLPNIPKLDEPFNFKMGMKVPDMKVPLLKLNSPKPIIIKGKMKQPLVLKNLPPSPKFPEKKKI